MLGNLSQTSIPELAKAATRLADRLLSGLVGKVAFGSPRYFLRLMGLGVLLGMAICAAELAFLGQNMGHRLVLLQSAGWRTYLFLPTIVTAVLMFPIDAFIAHTLVRWSIPGSASRTGYCMVLSAAAAYMLLAVGAGVAANVPVLVGGGVVIPELLWNRVTVAFFSPWTSSAQITHGERWLSYGAASASAALMGILASILFCTAALLRAFPERLRTAAVTPMFALLGLLAWFDQKKLNVPVKALAIFGAGVVFTLGCFLALLGL